MSQEAASGSSAPQPERAVPRLESPANQPAPQMPLKAEGPQRCPNCRATLAAQHLFCPKCGYSREELKHKREVNREMLVIAAQSRGALFHLFLMIAFYLVLLVLNFLSAYVLQQQNTQGVLIPASIIIAMCFFWWATAPSLVRQLSARVPMAVLVFIPLTACLTFGITLLNNSAFEWLVGLNQLRESTSGTERFFELSQPLWLIMLSVCVIPGIFEEVFFRGLMQGTLELSMSRREAWIVQALVFAIAHVNLIGFFTYLVFLGLYLGWLRNRFQSLLPGVLVHFTHNFLAVAYEQGLLSS